MRKKATAAGVGSTFKVESLTPKHVPQGHLGNPKKKELLRAIRLQQCCFCDDPRTFKGISQHWTRGHGIDLQEIRDILGVRKKTGFVSKETSAKYSANGKRNYDAERLVGASRGVKRQISAYGKRIQREKIAAMPETLRRKGLQEYFDKTDAEVLRLIRLRATRIAADKSRGSAIVAKICMACGETYYRNISNPSTVCSKACNEVRRRLHAAREYPANRIMKPCKHCGKEFYGHQLTCSKECREQNVSNSARARTDGHLDRIRQIRLANLRRKVGKEGVVV